MIAKPMSHERKAEIRERFTDGGGSCEELEAAIVELLAEVDRLEEAREPRYVHGADGGCYSCGRRRSVTVGENERRDDRDTLTTCSSAEGIECMRVKRARECLARAGILASSELPHHRERRWKRGDRVLHEWDGAWVEGEVMGWMTLTTGEQVVVIGEPLAEYPRWTRRPDQLRPTPQEGAASPGGSSS